MKVAIIGGGDVGLTAIHKEALKRELGENVLILSPAEAKNIMGDVQTFEYSRNDLNRLAEEVILTQPLKKQLKYQRDQDKLRRRHHKY